MEITGAVCIRPYSRDSALPEMVSEVGLQASPAKEKNVLPRSQCWW